MAAAKILLLFATTLVVVNAQFENNDVIFDKKGVCPPPLSINVCKRSCHDDGHCQGIRKCCPTNCGGTVCSRPFRRNPETRRVVKKAGSCPSNPTGPWICSSTCGIDLDCRGTRKCCRNRCGAFACQKPEVETVEIFDKTDSNEFPDEDSILIE